MCIFLNVDQNMVVKHHSIPNTLSCENYRYCYAVCVGPVFSFNWQSSFNEGVLSISYGCRRDRCAICPPRVGRKLETGKESGALLWDIRCLWDMDCVYPPASYTVFRFLGFNMGGRARLCSSLSLYGCPWRFTVHWCDETTWAMR